ncbi:MAG: hypothetical protein K2G45_12675 [Lachnospiraceae bacterium]|nr:hypothetical protein [Lachnospiraceae bacterium]
MVLDINNYLSNYSSWNSLRNYIIETLNLNLELNSDQETIDKIVIKSIREKSKDILLDESEVSTFDKKIRDYKNNNQKSLSFERTNLYRLLFVLEIDDMNEIFSFCRNIIHQQELSARSLDDFIVLCCLKLHISYRDYLKLNKSYEDRIKKMRLADKTLVYHITNEHKDYGIATINSIDALEKYVDEHIDEFARTRNTTYLMLFSCVSWKAWEEQEWINFFNIFSEDAPENYKSFTMEDWCDFANDGFGISNELMTKLIFVTYNGLIFDEFIDDEHITAYIIQKYKEDYEKDCDRPYNKRKYDTIYKILEKYRKDIQGIKKSLSIKDYYLRVFSLAQNGLSEEQINILAGKSSPYRNAFMTYDSYRDMYLRKSSSEIKQGVYLLSYIHHYDTVQGDYMCDENLGEYIPEEHICDLFNPKGSLDEQFRYINYIMAFGGFPELNENDMFNKLFMDVYKEVMTDASENESPAELKMIFLTKLSDYLKLITDKLK